MVPRQFKRLFGFLIFLSIIALLVSCSGGSGGVYPAPVLSSNANLASLPLSNGVLNPSFDSSIVEYAAMFIGQTSITLTPTSEDEGATIKVNGINVTSGQSTVITLSSGSNTITVVVTAADGTTTKTYTVIANRLFQDAYVKASNTGSSDNFGYSVSISGDTLAVGAPGESSNATGINGDQINNNASSSGAVYIFTRNGSTWSQQAYIKASNPGPGDGFGCSVSLSGNTLAVGAPGEASNATGINGDQTNNDASTSGAVYVFTRSGSTWTQQAYIKASNTIAFAEFGYSVSLYGDTLAVSAIYERSNATGVNGDQFNTLAPGSGAVYIFTRSGTTWIQQAYVKASNTESADNFGCSVSLYSETLAVGAYQESSDAMGINGDQINNDAPSSGAVYVFTRSGTTWTQQSYIKASNTGNADRFGYSLSLYGDTLAVGAHGESSNAMGINGEQTNNDKGYSGAVYVYTRTGTTWTQEAYVKASYTETGDRFGFQVSLSDNILAVGTTQEDSNATGINGDQTNNLAEYSGAAYVYTRTGTTWTQQAYIKASNAETFEWFGSSISVSGDTLVIGAQWESSNATGINGDQANNLTPQSGAIYIFR